MDPVTGLVTRQAIQGVTEVAKELVSETPTDSGSSEGSFEANLRSFLPANSDGMVNEEELFAAVIRERIQSLHGEEAATQYQEFLDKQKQNHTRADGYVFVEDAANAALSDMVAAGTLSAEEAGTVKSESFKAAQLDDNHEKLYDGRGSDTDATIAVADMESALLAARAMIEKIENGEVDAETTPVADETSVGGSTGSAPSGGSTITPEGNNVDGADGFVYKPESEKNGNLVILLPAQMAGEVAELLLKDENGNEVENGQDYGYANGGRQHFRFDKPGADYPSNLTVEVRMSDGSIVEYKIPNPSERYD